MTDAPHASPRSRTHVSQRCEPQIRLGDTAAVRNILKAGEADPLAPSVTIQQWTPLHCAAWGSINLKSDKDIAEALLLWAQKAKKEKEIRDAVEYAAVGFESACTCDARLAPAEESRVLPMP